MTESRSPAKPAAPKVVKVAVPEKATTAEGALRLLQLESEVRATATLRELIFHLANESRAALEFRQAFVLRLKRGRWRVEAISSVSTVERNAPLVRWIERLMQAQARAQVLGEVGVMSGDALTAKDGTQNEVQAFPHLVWVPLKTRDGKVFAGLVAARERPWPERLLLLGRRLSGVYSHAWLAITRGRITGSKRTLPRLSLLIAAAAVAALFLIRAPITAIAPVEVIGRDAAVVAAPLEGVVASIVVAPNEVVAAGDIVALMEDTELRNAAEIAERQVVMATARFDSLSSGAFADARARSEVSVAKAELALAEAERDLAQERLDRVGMRAPVNGIAVFADAREWIGRPVAVGERIMEIADPQNVEYKVSLPVDDLIAVQTDIPARIFLDSAPLEARRAMISRTSYHAVAQPDGVLAYDIRARDIADNAEAAPPRIGARGTAQVLGQDATLAFILFRRPIAWVRQTFGI